MTPERPRTQEPETTTVVERRRTGLVVLAIAVAALLGFGLGWAVFRDTGTDVPADVEELLDAYTDAWNNSDGQAAVAEMSQGARFYAEGYTGYDGLNREELIDWVDGARPDSIGTGSTTVVGDGPYVAVVENTVGNSEGYSVFMIDEQAGELLILDHVWMTG
jgi:hypothetical protein